MPGIHEVFPPAEAAANDPIARKKMDKGDGIWALVKELLGFVFDGNPRRNTVAVPKVKRRELVTVMSGWLRVARNPHCGVPFEIFQSTMEKVRHTFMALPAGKGLLSAYNKVLGKEPSFVFLSRNKNLRSAVADCRSFLRDSLGRPTPCKELVPA